MKRRFRLFLSSLAWFVAARAGVADTAGPSRESDGARPDVVVIIVDDWGYADFGRHGIRDDVRTPNMDRLAAQGAWFTQAYVTAPQCSPSRAAILTGRQQQRYGFDSITDGPLPLSEETVGNYLAAAGYRNGYVGKWHLAPSASTVDWNKAHIPGWVEGSAFQPAPDLLAPYQPWSRGFDFCVIGEEQLYERAFGARGQSAKTTVREVTTEENRILYQTRSALEFLDEAGQEPFCLFVSYYAPHVPMEAPRRWLDEFRGEMPERRRYALAMMAAVDEGVGQIHERLKKMNRADNTLMIFVSDNGAPLKRTKPDAPISYRLGAWNGSLNDPLNGEKGMLSEGGIRVPLWIAWPSGFPPRGALDVPVSSLDILPTILAAAGVSQPEGLDGQSLLPLLQHGVAASRDALVWRIWSQSAIRHGNWKLLRWGGGDDMLFDLGSDPGETRNLIKANPAVADGLRQSLKARLLEMDPDATPGRPPTDSEKRWYGFFFSDH